VSDFEVAGRGVEALVAELEAMATAHAGTAPAALKRRIADQLRGEPGGVTWATLESLVTSGSDGAKEVAAVLAVEHWPARPAEVAHLLASLALDPSWEVREWAAEGAARVVVADPSGGLGLLAEWVGSERPLLRRAAAVAAGWAAVEFDGEVVARLFELVAPLLADSSPPVRAVVGPFVVGDCLLRADPDVVVAGLVGLARHPDPHVRWAVAKAVGSAAARRHPALSAIGARLAGDEDPRVARAGRAAAGADRRRARGADARGRPERGRRGRGRPDG